MTTSAHAFDSTLSAKYARGIRQLVPRYDEMIHCIEQLVVTRQPRRLLDVGAGIGESSHQLLTELPSAHFTGLEACPQMAVQARHRLTSFGNRVRVTETDAREFSPSSPFDIVISNLVLHNRAPAEKERLIRNIHDWLPRGGAFIWGDFVRHENPHVHREVVRYRMEFARTAGCPSPMIHLNFEKEAKSDSPLTDSESIALLRHVGSHCCDLRWAHDTFAVIVAMAET